MATMVIGLVVFLGLHLIPALPDHRNRLAAGLGEPRYKGLFSLASFVGLALIVIGYALTERGPRLFAPLPAAIAAAPYAITLALILLAAANMKGHIRQSLQHPMLIGILIWSGVHLLANGDLRGTVLFGAFFVYALVDLVSAVRRHAVKSFVPSTRHDVIAIVAGVVVALVVMTLHPWLFGVRVVSFDF
jgi:uncharacterized membrane protein